MRDYSAISPKFWIGETGKKLRGDAPAQLLAIYLMTSPHSTMTGVFHCPVLYMAHETGLTMEGASKALARLSEAGFCRYDEASEWVFVVNMAAYQIGDSLKPTDNRVSGLRKDVDRMPQGVVRQWFLDVYGNAFNLSRASEKASPFEAPSKPLRSQEQEQEQEKEAKASSPESSIPDCPHETLIDLYAQHLPGLAQPRKSLWRGGKNAPAMRARWRWVMTAVHEGGERKGQRMATTSEEGIAWFGRFFEYVSRSDWLMGRTASWATDLGWLVNSDNFEKVLQGVYENKEN